jgi:hypothetical protein
MRQASMAPAFTAISLRLTEFEARPPAVQKLRKAITSTHERVKSWPTVRPHIPANKLQELGKLADQTTEWMDQNEKVQRVEINFMLIVLIISGIS